jgi:hypothetical protein
MKRILALCCAAALFQAECIKFGVPLLWWRIWRARRRAFLRAWVVDPGNWADAARAGQEAGDVAFLQEFLPAVERHRAARTASGG